MTTTFSGDDVGSATRRIAKALIEQTDRFNKLDAAGGDGDMGSTLSTVSRALLADDAAYEGDVGESLLRVAKVIGSNSGSSLSAVTMTGLMSLAESWTSLSKVPFTEVSPALETALQAMQARSGAELGDKTVLDGVAWIARYLVGEVTAEGAKFAAQRATADALVEYRNMPAMVGRLRLGQTKGVGVDDPGMVALDVAVAAMTNGSTDRTNFKSAK